METPLSATRFTRSRKFFENSKSRENGAKIQQEDRSALIDITNDSPIVGLAIGSLAETPSSKKKAAPVEKFQCSSTPFSESGEALLRGQVNTLLRKIEEEAEFSKVRVDNRDLFKIYYGVGVNSPINLIAAPTPANTPDAVNDLSGGESGGFPSRTPVVERFLIPQMQETKESDHLITRALLSDFSEKSSTEKQHHPSKEDDDSSSSSSSMWSIQANAADSREDHVAALLEEEEEEGICQEMDKKLSFVANQHIRFLYSSDEDEDAEEVQVKNKELIFS